MILKELQKQLNEAVEIPGDVSIEKLTLMLSAATRALGIANKLTNPDEKKKHLSQVMSGLHKIRGALRRMIKAAPSSSTIVEDVTPGELSSSEVRIIAMKIFGMAEMRALEDGRKAKKSMTGEMIHNHAKAMIKSLPEKIMIHVDDIIEEEFN